jgi:hypothetical protein
MRVMKDVRWKHAGIYDGINRRYIAGKFQNIRIGQGHDRMCKRTPWLQCRKPEAQECSCLSCRTPSEDITIEQQKFVVYTWIARCEDEIREEREAERQQERQRALESPRSSGTFDDSED